MISIIGNIKITNKTRFNYLVATLKSFLFAKDIIDKIFINIENFDQDFINKTILENISKQFNHCVFSKKDGNFGSIYCNLINNIDTKYFLHFEEDHFCVLNDIEYLAKITQENFDLMRATFFKIEQFRVKNIECEILEIGKRYTNNKNQHKKVNQNVASYFIGNNCIFNKSFGIKFWNRKINGKKPHAFEIKGFNNNFIHNYIVPNKEILCPIDDDHGFNNTCLLKRKVKKFNELYN